MSSRTLCTVLLVYLSAGCGGPITSADALTSALASAMPGDVIELGAVTIQGGFTVPAGVTLIGQGPDDTSVVGPCNRPTVLLQTRQGVAATELKDLNIALVSADEQHIPVGVLARGDGAARVERVDIRADFGVGVAVDGIANFSATDLFISGPVNPMIAAALEFSPPAYELATHGLVLLNVPSAMLTRVSTENFGVHGVISVDSSVNWSEGEVAGGFGGGLATEGGALTANNLIISNIEDGASNVPAVGAIFLDTDVDSTALSVTGVSGYGLFHDGGQARHLGITVQQNRDLGLLTNNSMRTELSGLFDANQFAGVLALSPAELSVHDAIIRATQARQVLFDVNGGILSGDGLQLVQPTSATLENVTLEMNERVGIVLDLAGATTDVVSLSSVSVTVTSTTQGGVVAQNGSTVMGWDSGVTRVGTDAQNDAALAGYDVLRMLGPGDRPQVSPLRAQGISAVINF